MLIRFGYDITISCAQPTALVCLMSPRRERAADLRGPEIFRVSPEVPVTTFLDTYGNLGRRMIAPAGKLTLRGDGLMQDSGLPDPEVWDAAELPVSELPTDVLPFLAPSRYCESDLLSQAAWDRFGQIPPGWGRIQAISDFAHDHIGFDYGCADATRTSMGSYREGAGVCRDYAHLMIAFTRALNVPARYVNGYLGDIGVPYAGPMDFCAWVEVYLGGAWHTFDPRNNARRVGRIVIARGRDAADVPMITSFGPHVLTSFEVHCDEVPELSDRYAAE